MQNRIPGIGLLILMTLVIGGCATKRPVLYPNEKWKAVGEAGVERDIEECLAMAANAGLEKQQGKEVVGDAAKGAVAGGVVGAAVGAVTGDFGRGAGIGAAGGGAAGATRGIFSSRDPDPLQRVFVEQCLRERGYQTIGWR